MTSEDNQTHRHTHTQSKSMGIVIHEASRLEFEKIEKISFEDIIKDFKSSLLHYFTVIHHQV